LDHLDDPDTADANRAVVKGFYGILKSMDAKLRFTMITGVSKFTKTSIFSELNNLLDITMMEKYANICGVTLDDFDAYFGEHIAHLSTLKSFKRFNDIRGEILAWYDGYSWDGETRVLNPFSLLSFFVQERFHSYWYASGTPTFLMKILKNKPESFLNLKNLIISELLLEKFDVRKIEAEPLLFQTGYLTIREKRYDDVIETYLLKIPNLEVREAFYLQIIAEFTETSDTYTATSYRSMREALRGGDLQAVLELLRGLFASIPYNLHINYEAYYHSIFYAVMRVLGFDTDAEVLTSKGRLDATLTMPDKVYVMEFKYVHCEPDADAAEKRRLADEALEEGMKQIKNREYHKQYIGPGKTI
jgi:hypothetical protein